MKGIKLIILGCITVLILSILSQKIYFPTDILNYLQTFTFDGWAKAHNSLLADPIFQFEPWRIFTKNAFLHGHLPLWNPQNGGGTPFLANPQTAVFYPLNIIYYLLPINLSLNLIAYLKLSLYSYFVFLYLRSIKISNGNSTLGAIISLFAAFPIMWVLWPHTNVFILFPLLLFLTEKMKERKRKHLYFLSLTYFVGVLGGHPETLFHIGILHFAYSLFSFRRNKDLLLKEIKYILLGFLLASFMLIPFFEYVLFSDLLTGRISNPVGTFLPVLGASYNFFPYFLGAPQWMYYKVPFIGTNFQELAGGYVGLWLWVIILFGIFRFYKNAFVKFILVLILLLLGIIYKIWPFWLIVSMPVVSAVANQRLVGFVGFFAIILFTIVIEHWSKKSISKNIQKKVRVSTYIISGTLISFVVAASYLVLTNNKSNSQFIQILLIWLLVFIISTASYLYFMISWKNGIRIFLLTLLICVIQGIVFLSYNPLNSHRSYYPASKFIEVLREQPKGNIIEVGNLLFPPNLNLAYGLSHAQSDDAIGVRIYSEQFKKVFPVTNFWGRIDQIDQQQANRMDVDYIVSDHDVNFKSDVIQKELQQINVPLEKIVVPIRTRKETLGQVRILTANFNRRNVCTIVLQILEDEKLVVAKKIPCAKVGDKMFLTIPVGRIQLREGHLYSLTLSLSNSNTKNTIGFWGNNKRVPYLELLYERPSVFAKIWQKDSVYLFKNEKNSLIEGLDSVSIKENEPTHLLATGVATQAGIVTVKKTKYPGWNIMLDGKKIDSLPHEAFFRIPVRAGNHLISLVYTPFSFYVGLIISLITAFFMVIGVVKHLDMPPSIKMSNTNPRLVSFISISVSILVYALVLGPISSLVEFKSSGSINWLNIHEYAKGIDFVSIIIFFVINIGVFLVLLCINFWRKKNK